MNDGTKHLMAGVGRVDVTPAPGTPQGIWGAATHQRGVGADMPLYASALTLSSGEETVLIVEVDSIGFDPEWAAKILAEIERLTGISREFIRLSASHTHSGANTFRLGIISEGLDMAESYMESLPLSIAGAAWQAKQNMRPVRMGVSTGVCRININRRVTLEDGSVIVGSNEYGPSDPTVNVLRFDDLDEHPVACIVHYACHPTTVAWQCQYFTPDYPGIVRETVERELGGMCLYLQGAAGNLGPRRGFTGDLRKYRKLGHILGLEASKIALQIETLPREEHFRGVLQSGAEIALYEEIAKEPASPLLKAMSREVKLPLKDFESPDVLKQQASIARAELDRLRNSGPEAEIRAANARATQIGDRAANARRFHGHSHIAWPVHAIQIGSTAILSVSGEPFTETNEHIVSHSPFPQTLFCGYSPSAFGYLPTLRAYDEGGYEIGVSPFAPGAAELLADSCIQILQDLASK